MKKLSIILLLSFWVLWADSQIIERPKKCSKCNKYVILSIHNCTYKKCPKCQKYVILSTHKCSVKSSPTSPIEKKSISKSFEVSFVVNAPEATIRIDGVDCGISTTKKSLAEGMHKIEVTAPKYEKYTQEVYVDANKVIDIQLISYPYLKTLAKAIEPYRNIGSFCNGYAPVMQNDKWGFINKDGELAIACIYDNARAFSEGFAAVKISDKWGFVDKHGKLIVDCIYDGVGKFSESMAAVNKEGKWGFINQSGDLSITCQYDDVGDFVGGRTVVKNGEKYSFISKSGNDIFKRSYDVILCFPKYALGFDYSGKKCQSTFPEYPKAVQSFVNYDVIGPYTKKDPLFKRKAVSENSIGTSWIFKDYVKVGKDDKYGFANAQGDMIIECRYEGIEPFSEGFAAAEVDSKWGFIDEKGTIVIENKYAHGVLITHEYNEAYDYNLNEKKASDKSSDTNRVKTSSGRFSYYGASLRFMQGFARVTNGKKFGYIDASGRVLNCFCYDRAEDFSEGLAAVKKDGKWGYIDIDGNSTFDF